MDCMDLHTQRIMDSFFSNWKISEILSSFSIFPSLSICFHLSWLCFSLPIFFFLVAGRIELCELVRAPHVSNQILFERHCNYFAWEMLFNGTSIPLRWNKINRLIPGKWSKWVTKNKSCHISFMLKQTWFWKNFIQYKLEP